MRFSPRPELVRNSRGDPTLLILSPGSSAEQLFGIVPLQQMLGMAPSVSQDQIGLPARTQRQAPPGDRVAFWRMPKTMVSHSVTGLIVDANTQTDLSRERDRRLAVCRGHVRRELYLERTNGASTTTGAAWSGNDFGILTSDPEVALFLADVHAGLMAGEGQVALWLCASHNPYGRSSLILGLTSRIEESDRTTLLESDRVLLADGKLAAA
jgi:hypothetical protein